ncbi:MAG: sulfotransferase-like domain-containing protein [Paracoccaceae bacterium]
MRIAMWSGPRNLSTAMMYAFAARSDCAVVDEPFYAAYLAKTGLKHPMRAEILAAQSHDPDEVIKQITGTIPGYRPVFYQKHMAQHMVPGIDRDWMKGVVNVFLIRHPARVIASYAKKRQAPTLDDIGIWQQTELYEQVISSGRKPIVIDSTDIRADPNHALASLCSAIGLDYETAMQRWPKGGHADDGVWASHWYGAVHESTGFAGAEGELPQLSGKYAELLEQALPFYEKLVQHALFRP